MLEFNKSTLVRISLPSLILFFTLFPYIGINFFPSDIQPYALLLGVIYLLRKNKISLLREHYFLIIPIAIAFLGLFFDFSNPILWTRSFTGYVSFMIFSITFYNISNNYNFPILQFKRIVYIWVFFALMQLILDKSFGSFLVANFRVGGGRGILSLAPEPAYLGIIGFYLSIISYSYLNEKKLFYLSLLLIILSQSLFSILVASLYFLPILLKKVKVVTFLIIIFLIIISYNEIFLTDRLLKISSILIKNPTTFYYLDASSSDRIFHLLKSFQGFIDNFGIPNGYNFWRDYAISEYNNSDFIFLTTGRIMSTYGSMLFELGIFAFPLIFFIIKKSKKIGFIDNKLTFIAFNFSLLFAVPLALPILPLILHLKYFNIEKEKR